MNEPNPVRDNGPFLDASQVLKQYAAQTHGMPFGNDVLTFQLVQEALLLAGVKPSEFEIRYFRESNDHHYDPVLAQIFAGWIIRACIAGAEKIAT